MKKLYWIVLLWGCACTMLAQNVSEVRVNERFDSQPLLEVIQSLQAQYPIRIYYQESWFEGISVNGDFDTTLQQFLDQVLEDSGLSFRLLRDRQIVFISEQNTAPPAHYCSRN